MSYIKVKNLNFGYNEKKLFNNITFDIQKNSLTCISTPSSKGKTTLLNILGGNIKLKDTIYIDNKEIFENINIIDNKINFYCISILEELMLISKDIKLIKKYLKEFGLSNYINESPFTLTYIQMQKLNLIKALLSGSEIILIDNIFSYFDNYSKIEFIGLLKKYQYENNITIVYTTNNLDDTIFCDKIIIIDKVVMYDGKIENMYLDNKLIQKSKLNVPLEHELVEKLKLYNIINNVNYTIEEVVDEICKLN